jgi:predicted nucleic acid-binding Zn ribbon protein
MPTYEFRNKETGEVSEVFMKMSAKEQYLIDNPNLEQTMTQAPAFTGDHIILKKDSGFKEVLQKINERVPGGMKQSGSSQL